MKMVLMPRGITEVEDNIIGGDGQIRVDSTRNELRVHDGVTLGGHRIPNERTVQTMIASGVEGGSGRLLMFATEADLMAASPTSNAVAMVSEAGKEAFYLWRPEPGDQTSLPSSINGSWLRLDSGVTEVMRLWRAGWIYLKVDSVPPQSNQAKTVWITGNEVMLWDGSEYVPSTPELFAALLAEIGGYSTETFLLPPRLQAQTSIVADLNEVTESGWVRTNPSTLNAPPHSNTPVQTFRLSATAILQVAYAYSSVDPGSIYLRRMTSGVWRVWTRIEDLFTNLAISQVSGLQNALDDLQQEIDESDSVPTGSVIGFALPQDLAGYLFCDGRAVSRTTYAKLFTYLGTAFGAGNGSTTFNLPNYAGLFLRGFNPAATGYDSGRVFGQIQADQIKEHTHSASSGAAGGHTHTGTAASAGAHTHTGSAASAGAHTHPIQYRSQVGGGGAQQIVAGAPGQGGNNNPPAFQTVVNIRTTSAGAHTHSLTINSSGAHTHTLSIDSVGNHSHSITVTAFGGNETRPVNQTVYYCIKT